MSPIEAYYTKPERKSNDYITNQELINLQEKLKSWQTISEKGGNAFVKSRSVQNDKIQFNLGSG